MQRLAQIWREETAGFHLRLQLARLFLGLLPPYTGARVRPVVYRLAGFKIPRSTTMMGNPTFTGTGPIAQRFSLGENCWLNIGVLINLGADVTIGDRVAIGHEVMILTDSHEIGPSEWRAGAVFSKPVRIGSGAWLGARSLILPGITIGAGAIVAAGAVVTRDVPANTLAAGVPAKIIRELDH